MTLPFEFQDHALTWRPKDEPKPQTVAKVMGTDEIAGVVWSEFRRAIARVNVRIAQKRDPLETVARAYGTEQQMWQVYDRKIFVASDTTRSVREELHALREMVARQVRQTSLHEQRIQELERELRSRKPAPVLNPETPLPVDSSAIRGKIEALKKVFEVQEPTDVALHIAKRPRVFKPLVDAASELKNRFGTGLRLLAREDRLVIVVETSLEVRDAEALLAKFRREWWHEQIDVEDRLTVKLRYV